MLRPKRDEVVYGGSVIPLNVCAKELPSLRESDRVETVLELRDVRNLFSDKFYLFVHVSVLQCFGEWTVGVYRMALDVRSWPCALVLGPLRCRPSE
jgi:hypothetical protein